MRYPAKTGDRGTDRVRCWVGLADLQTCVRQWSAREPTVSSSRPIALLDVPWLAMDTRRHPMHVAGLIICEAPENAAPRFVHDIVDDMRRFTAATDPFDRRMHRRGWGRIWPRWESQADMQLDYRLQQAALPWPGGERELGALVSRLHRAPLDLGAPLWEVHVIEGLDRNRFAIYAKFHHSIVDGVGAIRILRSALSTDPAERDMPPMWAVSRPKRRSPGGGGPGRRAGAARIVGALAGAIGALRDGQRVKPYRAPRSVLNTSITSQRRIATQTYDTARLRRLSVAMGGTLNDVMLAVCATALRRYLLEIDALPAEPLMAAMPVSVRPADGADTGNAISFAFASLATNIENGRERTAAIMASAARAKAHLARLPKDAIDAYTVMTMGRFILTQVLGLGAKTPPMFNVAISNLPGPQKDLYYNGAKVVEIYPISVLQSGQALNITALSYGERLNFAFTACASSLPQVQRLSVYCGDALDELDAEFNVAVEVS